MHQNFIFICIALLALHDLTTVQSASVDCIDTLEDLQASKWGATPDSPPLHYAATSLDLPGILSGTMDGEGIFYYESQQSDYYGDGLSINSTYLTGQTPVYMYVRYYGHDLRVGYPPKMIIYPIESPYDYPLEATTNFTWGEDYTQLFPIPVAPIVGAWAWQMDEGEYFLLDQVIFTQGLEIRDLEHIKGLCNFKEMSKDRPNSKVQRGSRKLSKEIQLSRHYENDRLVGNRRL
jgi:hypothetical protein